MAKRLTSKKCQPSQSSPQATITWSEETELVGLVFELAPYRNDYLYPQYTIGLHAWFLAQVQQINPELSRSLHDEQSEKAFTISGLEGKLLTSSKDLQLQADQTYRWYINILSQSVAQWAAQWVQNLPSVVELRNAPLRIVSCEVALAPTTYKQLLTASLSRTSTIQLTFLTPTSFRSKQHHFPLPVPKNLFHSYLRRWNSFSGIPIPQDDFLNWIEETVIIHRHKLESAKVTAGKKGSVTGFTGAVELGLSKKADENADFAPYFYALSRLAPYCGTGHKTTFGLGQTRMGWLLSEVLAVSSKQDLLASRIAELTEAFMAERQRTGGTRALEVAETWATILARRELGESLSAIALDLEMPYETVKTYVKLARRSLQAAE
ncbi:MAG: CRISPR-associated endoribonuclease Cas6 [Actinomycetota bacterium]